MAEIKAAIADLEATPSRSREEVRRSLHQQFTAWAADAERTTQAHVKLVAEREPADALFKLTAGPGNAVNLGPLLAVLIGPDAMLQALSRFVAAVPEGVPAAERAARLDASRADLFAAELAEEHVVVGIEAAGQRVRRRADADPAAVLALQDTGATDAT